MKVLKCCNTIFKLPRRGVSQPKELHFRCLAPVENEFQQGWFGLTVNLSKSFHPYMKSKRSGIDINSSPDHQKQYSNGKNGLVKTIPIKKAKKNNFSSAPENEQALIGLRRPGLADFPHPVPHPAVSLRDYTARESNPPATNTVSAHVVFKTFLLSNLSCRSLALFPAVSG